MTPPKKPFADFSDVQGGASSTAPVSKPDRPEPRTYTVVKGDSLSRIAKAIYGDAGKWKAIYAANRQVVGDNPDLIKPGQVLVIPELEGGT